MTTTPSKYMEKKLDIIAQHLAKGKSLRSIEIIMNTDRSTIKKWFDFGIKFSPSYAKRVSHIVLRDRLGYSEIIKKYGKRGLTAIYSWKFKQNIKDNYDIAKKILDWRKRGLTYTEIQELTGRSISSIYRTLISRFGYQALIGNTLYRKCKERDKQLYKDYKDGMDIYELSAKYKKSPVTIRWILREKFKESRIAKSIGERYYLKIKLLRSKGLSWKEIAYIIGHPASAVRQSYTNYLMRRHLYGEKEG